MDDDLQLLQFQINLISARDLAAVSKSMQTYAVLYINPDQKMTGQIDRTGNNSPEWNEKFTFWVVPQILYSDACIVNIEIYAKSWIKDVLVGSVQIPAHQIIPANPTAQTRRAVALQIRRSSGRPQGILNIGVSLLEESDMSRPLSGVGGSPLDDKTHNQTPTQTRLHGHGSVARRVKSDQCSSVGVPDDDRSFVNGPAQCGSMCSSDVGPSASVVAEAVARGLYVPPRQGKGRRRKGPIKDDGESSILQWADEESDEAMKAKLERWKKEMAYVEVNHDVDMESTRRAPRPRRRNKPPPKAKVFRCFGNAYGFEFTIVCGGNQGKKVHNKKVNRAPSMESSYLDL